VKRRESPIRARSYRVGGHPLTLDSSYLAYLEKHGQRCEAKGPADAGTECEKGRNVMINARDVYEPEDERPREEKKWTPRTTT
jgi:hypothetical protein